jgi:hypothetical protein
MRLFGRIVSNALARASRSLSTAFHLPPSKIDHENENENEHDFGGGRVRLRPNRGFPR